MEQRAGIGGTWDLFRYPGIRSDSDMRTLGFRFRPWTDDTVIASGESILGYLDATVREYGILERVRFGRRAVRASWSSEDAEWSVDVAGPHGPERWRARYLWFCAGYYRYDAGHDPAFPGRERFSGPVVHPQRWPPDLDWQGRRVVVIGSGATAFTLTPALARDAAHVTMLQRSPTYVASVPARDQLASHLARFLPHRWAGAIARWRNIVAASVMYWAARRWPAPTRRFLIDAVRRQLPDGFDVDRHFTPTYAPWDQRICAVPDGDFFRAVRDGRLAVVTDHIDTFTETGVRLRSGEELECDVIVTATGLEVQMHGGTEVVVDGVPLDTGDLISYKGTMYAGVPNVSASFGYVNASWTLRADLCSEFTCRVLRHLDATGAASATPRLPPRDFAVEQPEFAPGYLRRAFDRMPKRGTFHPWRLAENYPFDLVRLRWGRLDDGTLEFA